MSYSITPSPAGVQVAAAPPVPAELKGQGAVGRVPTAWMLANPAAPQSSVAKVRLRKAKCEAGAGRCMYAITDLAVLNSVAMSEITPKIYQGILTFMDGIQERRTVTLPCVAQSVSSLLFVLRIISKVGKAYNDHSGYMASVLNHLQRFDCETIPIRRAAAGNRQKSHHKHTGQGFSMTGYHLYFVIVCQVHKRVWHE